MHDALRSRLAALALLVALGCERGARYTAVGDVVAVDEGAAQVTIRHDDIPGLMPAMTMRFALRSARVIGGTSVGTRVRFDLVRRGDDLVVTRLVPIGAAGTGRPGIHDHTPHHGGVVAMVGMLHLEAIANAAGGIRVYLTDVWRRPLPLADVSGSVTVSLPAEKLTLPLAARADALEASGPPFPGATVLAHVQLLHAGAPLEMRFVLPLDAEGGGGAAEVPLEGCVPVDATAAAGRLPRCVLDFRQPVTFVATTPHGATGLVAVVNGGVSAWAMPPRFLHGFAAAPPIVAPADATPHADAANAVAVSPNGRETVVAVENRLLVHETASGGFVRELPAFRGVVRGVAWSPDSSRLMVTLFYDATAHLLAAGDGAELRRVPVEREGAAVAFSADGRAAIGDELGSITLVDPSRREEARLLVGSQRPIEALAFAGDRLVSTGGDGVVRIWDVGTGTVAARSEVHGALYRLAVAPGGRVVASAGLDRVIRLHDLATGALLEAIAWHQAGIWGLAWAGPLLISGDAAGRVAFWELADRVAR